MMATIINNNDIVDIITAIINNTSSTATCSSTNDTVNCNSNTDTINTNTGDSGPTDPVGLLVRSTSRYTCCAAAGVSANTISDSTNTITNTISVNISAITNNYTIYSDIITIISENNGANTINITVFSERRLNKITFLGKMLKMLVLKITEILFKSRKSC